MEIVSVPYLLDVSSGISKSGDCGRMEVLGKQYGREWWGSVSAFRVTQNIIRNMIVPVLNRSILSINCL